MKPIRHGKVSSGEVGLTSISLHALALCLLALPAAGQTRVSNVQEAIDRWAPESHVYVIGEVGLKPAALTELESWLKGRHWTVLLVADASGQTFQDANGVTREGVDAIEYGTGQRMAGAAGFAAQTHPKTGEPDGAILSIVMAQRALYFTGSKAQDDRGLGEAAFAGNLDRLAIECMRNGGDIAAAVRNTVTNVDSLLAAEVERPVREAREAIEIAASAVTALEETAAVLRAAPSKPSGSLARPDTRPLLEDLDRARAQAETEPAAAHALTVDVLSRVGHLREPIERYKLAAPILDGAWKQLGELRKRKMATAAAEPLETARQALVEGRALYLNADPDYVERLDRGQAALSQAQETIAAAEKRAEAEALAHNFLWFLAICILVSVFWGLNRRRLGVKEEAEALLASWQTALDRKLEALFGELEQRISRLGPISGEGRGQETEALAASVRADVGALIILWTSARAVLEQAREHIRPQRAAAKVANFFLPGHYRKGIALLRDEPVPFDPEEDLPRLFGSDRGWRDDLLGDLASYEPFRMSFKELMSEFHSRAERAARGLDDLETALTKLPELLESLQDRTRPVPVAAAALEDARKTMTGDPVQSLRACRRAARAVELSERLPQARSEIEAGEHRIAEARQELGTALGIDPESLFREADQDPSERLAGAVRQADAARAALDLFWDIDGSGSALEQAKLLTLEAAALVDRTLEAGRSWERDSRERRAATERLAALVPGHEALAARLQEEFGQSDQALKSGGMAAARAGIEAARHDLDAASAALREGRALAAAALLRQVGAHQEQAGRSLAEIMDELDRLREEAAERARQEERRRREEEERSSYSSSTSSSSTSSSSTSSFSSSSDSSSGSDSGSSGSSWSDSSSGSGSSSWESSGSGSGKSGW